MSTRQIAVLPVNVAVIVGQLTRPPRYRSFETRPSITSFDVKVKGDETDVVRVTWFNAPSSALELEEGETVAVIGRVRRYWFGGNQSVTDVVAQRVVTRPTQAKARRLIESVYDILDEAVA